MAEEDKKPEENFSFINDQKSSDDSSKKDNSNNEYHELFINYGEEEKPKAETVPDWVPEAGAAAGAYGSYKGFGMDLFKPHESVFSSPSAPPRPAPAPTAQGMSDVEHLMQSGQGAREGQTGRMRESAHNWETNRQALAAKEGLNRPGASRVVVQSGPMTPTKSGVAIPQSVAAQMEEERLMQEARIRVERQAAEKAAAEKAASSEKLLGLGKGVAKVGLGALGGGLAAKDIYEAIAEMRARGIDDENIAKLLGGVGGGLMVIPTPLTEAGGAALVGGSMAWPHVRERFGFKDKH